MKKHFLLIIFIFLLAMMLLSNDKAEKKVEYYDNGNKKAEGQALDGKPDGLWIWWYEDGQKWAERNFKKGIPDGKARAWYKNGKQQGETNFKNGRYDGPFIIWYESGTKKQESYFKDGLKIGKESHWYPNGQIKMEGYFQDDKAHGTWAVWDESGYKTSQLEYREDLLHGTCLKRDKENISGKKTEYRQGIVKDIPVLSGPYLGQRPPGMAPRLFAPGVISTDNQEIHCVFSPDGKEVYYSMSSPLYFGGFSIYFMKEEKGKWTYPQLAPFNLPGYNSVSAFSPGGKGLYFNARPPGKEKMRSPYNSAIDIWYVERTGSGWGKPFHLGPAVNSGKQDIYPSVSANGNLYFTSDREGGKGSFDLYRSELKNGEYTRPVNLGDAVNTAGSELHSCIAPDESYLLFDSDGFEEGRGLYVSFRKKDGTWTKARYLGEAFNAVPVTAHVNISADGKYIFTSGAINPKEQPYPNRDIYWADAKVIEQFRPGK